MQESISRRAAAAFLNSAHSQIAVWEERGLLKVAKTVDGKGPHPFKFYSLEKLKRFRLSEEYLDYVARRKVRSPRKEKESEEGESKENTVCNECPLHSKDTRKQFSEMLAWYGTVHGKPKSIVIPKEKEKFNFSDPDECPPLRAFDGFQEAQDILLSYGGRTGSSALQIASLVTSHKEWKYDKIAKVTIQNVMDGRCMWSKQQEKWYPPLRAGKMKVLAFILRPLIPGQKA